MSSVGARLTSLLVRRCLAPAVKQNRIIGYARPFSTQTIKVEMPDELSKMAAPAVPRVPRPQDPAPGFIGQAVVNRSFKEISLKDYNGKWLLFFFYPLDFTFVCPTEIISFSDRVGEFNEIGCEVVACSTDSHFTHLAWINTPRKEGGLGDLKIPLLADYTKRVSKDYGVLLDGMGAALRGLFLIDPKGVVRHTCVNDLPVGRSVDEALRLVKAFQFFEKNGEVCPANWTPDSPSINPADAKKYFNKVN